MFTQAFPILTTPDLPRSLGFYRDLLGFEVTYRFPADGDPVYVGLRLAGSELGIGADPDFRPGADRVPAAAPPFDLCVYARDCDAAVAHLRAAGVPVLAEPAAQAWGERMARVADPDGNRLVILSSGDPAAAGPAGGD
jgi:lactoylglutathione lyase